MKCPKCQFENPEGIKFCGDCGAELKRICPNCNSPNPPKFKFCGECGHDLTRPQEVPPKDLSFDEKLTKILKYLPKGLTEKILSQKDRIEGERKLVTVMFCDMEGFTSLSESLGPDEAYAIMDQVYEILIHKVHDYQGTVNEFTGDGIMALFGAPIALEDAPQRAIRSAYAIHREMTKFSDKIKEEKQNVPPIKMRIGIHTGPVVVGTLGNDLRVEFKAVGDTVNLSSRIEGLAVPGSTYISEDTFKLTEGLFRFEALGEYAVKGKAESVKAYRVIAPSTSRTRFDVSAERGLTPFVGRERELELLLDGFERSKSGRGQAFSIVAEAGVGKSRLLYEFRKAVANEDVFFQEGKCLSYSRDVTYHPVIDIVKSNSNIVEGDSDLEIREKLKRDLKILGVDEASTLPYFLELLSVEDSGVDLIPLSPEARKDRITEALNRSTIKASQIRPLIMAIEDLHWIDKSSEDTLKALLESIAGERIFLIFTYRPEYVHTWGSKSYHNQITLNRLSNRESLSVVKNLLSNKDIENDLEELILEKTEGVPFFIEEFIKSLKDLKFIEKHNNIYQLAKNVEAVSIPSTIQDVIMARVDTLPEEAKELLQVGSAIERMFNYELIKQVSKLSEEKLLSLLSVLKDAEVIFERGIYPESNYIFKHALTQEVVYDSILSRKKKELHNKTGEAIEQLYKDNIHEHYGVLAEHFIIGENYEKGAEYCQLAARKAEKAGTIDDAVTYGEKRVTCLEQLPQTEDREKDLIDARTVLGLYYGQMAHEVKAKAAVEPIVNLAVKLGYKRRLSQIYCIIGQYYFQVEEDIPRALKCLKDSLKIGKELNDLPSLVLANMWIGFCKFSNGEFQMGFRHLEKSLEINVAANSLWGISVMKAIIAIFYNIQGKPDLGYKYASEALRAANESGDVYSKMYAHLSHGYSFYNRGYLEKAKDHLLKCSNLFDKIQQPALAGFAHRCLAEIYFVEGKYSLSQKHNERAIYLYQKNRLYPSYVNINKLALMRAKLMNKEKGLNLAEIFKCYNDNKDTSFEGYLHNCIAVILLNSDAKGLSEAEDWIKKAIEKDKKNDMRWYLANDYALYAEIFKRRGDPKQAKEKLITAIGIFKECGADGWVGKYEKELASLS